MNMPRACMTPKVLRELAQAIEQLNIIHTRMRGPVDELPCLRRVEVTEDPDHEVIVVAHISIGPDVGGTWERLVLWMDDDAPAWRLIHEDLKVGL